MKSRGGRALAVGVLLLAAVLRLWQLSQTPPGLHHDEAFHLLRAEEIARGEAFPAYITGNQGNEPLFTYLSAIALAMLGPVPWAGRLVSAWLGVVGIAATMRVGAEMFPKRNVGAIAGLILAALLWHVNASRFGTQPIIAATAASGALAALWHAARTGRRWAFVLAGASVGLGLTGYVAYRLFVVVPAIAGLALMAAWRHKRRSLLIGNLLAGLVAFAVFLPLGLFFLQHPEWFFNRFNQVTAATLRARNPAETLVDGALKTAGGLFWHGDENWRQNLPGRPGLDAVQTVFFFIGCGVCLRQPRQPQAWTLLAWLLMGLLPSALTEYSPQFWRAIAATPAIALLTALGVHAVWARTARHVASRPLVVAALMWSASFAVRDYFWRWARDPSLFAAFDVAQQWMAQELRAAPEGSALYETPVPRDWYTFEFTLGREAFERFKTFDGRRCTVIPKLTAATTAYAVVPGEDPFTLPLLESAFPAGGVDSQLVRTGTPHAIVFQIPAGHAARVTPDSIRRVDFGGIVGLVGYSVTADLAPGGGIELTMVWEAEAQTPAAYKSLLALLGAPRPDGGVIYAQHDAEPCGGTYPSWRWAPGELVIDRLSLPLPADLPPGEYQLVTAWYDSGTLQRLPADDELRRAPGDAVVLEEFTVAGR